MEFVSRSISMSAFAQLKSVRYDISRNSLGPPHSHIAMKLVRNVDNLIQINKINNRAECRAHNCRTIFWWRRTWLLQIRRGWLYRGQKAWARNFGNFRLTALLENIVMWSNHFKLFILLRVFWYWGPGTHSLNRFKIYFYCLSVSSPVPAYYAISVKRSSTISVSSL